MAGRTVTTPTGVRWRVRRQWAPRLGSESMWERFRRRARPGRWFGRGRSDAATPDPNIDTIEDLVLVLIVVLVVAILFVVGIPLLVALVDLALLVLLTLCGVAARVVFRRPWVVEAKPLAPAVDGEPDGSSRKADPPSATARRRTWRVVGWGASRDAVDQIADALAHGVALPPGGGT